uniref:Uncharacterized protein n=1 Tax=Arundo donax TaxID=35708 RepID=A0A0A8XQB2_ARUDO
MQKRPRIRSGILDRCKNSGCPISAVEDQRDIKSAELSVRQRGISPSGQITS